MPTCWSARFSHWAKTSHYSKTWSLTNCALILQTCSIRFLLFLVSPGSVETPFRWSGVFIFVSIDAKSICQKWSTICNSRFPGPTRVVDANGISITSVVFCRAHWVTDRGRPRYSVGNNRRSAQWRSQILLLSMVTTSIYWSSQLKYTMPAFPS